MLDGIANLPWFIAAGILLNLTPGPDVLYILSQSIKSGWRTGAVAALGITAGCLVHVTAAALGLSALMATSSMAFSLLKWLGAAYLVWVGWQILGLGAPKASRSQTNELKNATYLIAAYAISTGSTAKIGLKIVFAKGFWTNVLNPKVALFFLAFLPQFIAPDAPHKTLIFLLLGLIFAVNSLWVSLGYAALGATVSQRFAVMPRGIQHLERLAGVLFIGFGLKLALMDNPASP
ncbi:MAG: LysE family translocator [Rhodoferax sp.]|uniref:LysE family translocator n=1 Tax=Rhodoferax sp. TaxID=50421 RepID=UPI00301B6278